MCNDKASLVTFDMLINSLENNISARTLLRIANNFIFSVILTFINCWNVNWATVVQDFFTFAKLFALLIIIIAGIMELFHDQKQPSKYFFQVFLFTFIILYLRLL